MIRVVTIALAAIGLVSAVVNGWNARSWNDEVATASPLVAEPSPVDDPHTPRLARRVVLVVIDGLGAAESKLPFLDELRARGVGITARVPYPTISRPNYVTILTGVQPRDSGVRANKVAHPVTVDTIMDRAQAAQLRVASASDYGSLASLFLRHTTSMSMPMIEDGTTIRPAPPVTWPFDEVRRTESLDALGGNLVELEASDAALIPVLVLDVDRAGHASGVGDDYREAARNADRMLRTAIGALDLSRDAVVITADHGHVSLGGHGGDEDDVSVVSVVMAGAGVRAGAHLDDARLMDVAPTVAALLGIAAPAHAGGRTLTELIQLAPDDAQRRIAIDHARMARMDTIASAALVSSFDPLRLVVAIVSIGAAIALAVLLVRRGAIVFPGGLVRALPTSMIAMTVITLSLVAITRGHMSPSYIPSLARVEKLGALGIVVGIAVQSIVGHLLSRRAPDRRAAGNGLAIASLAIALGILALVRAWYSPPYAIVPSPLWMVLVPTLELAAATAGLAAAVGLGVTAVVDRRAARRSRRHAATTSV